MNEYYNRFFNETMSDAYTIMGAHVTTEDNQKGVRFSVWAPHARTVQVVGDFNHWDGGGSTMNRVDERGMWSLFIPYLREFEVYKYKIETWDGRWFTKADPYAFYSEVPPKTGSVTYDLNHFPWRDGEWMEERKTKNPYESPMNIYEVHLGSWMKNDQGDYLGYEDFVQTLIPYVKGMGYNYIELMPLMEHPFDGSWGYQLTGYFSATSRYGDPKKLMYLIEECHLNGIGVLLDWVPVHFVKDQHGLIEFDGEDLYEYPYDDIRENELWGTRHFDLGRREVRNFLISSARFWLEYFHVDGIRVDAVANVIYFFGDSSRGTSPNGLDFLRELNIEVHKECPGALMIAEDSTSYPLVTEPVYNGGLGFDFKWNMGWMNDILKFMETHPSDRKDMHQQFTFSLMYAFNEKFILPFSHDEVVHGKKSLIDKMPGDYWQKFADLRLLMGYMFTHPGKNMIFMGSEFAQFSEWSEQRSLEWTMKDYPMHDNFTRYVHDLNLVYLHHDALYEQDFIETGFEWIDVNNAHQSIYSFIRRNKAGDELIVICNFMPNVYYNFQVGVNQEGTYQELLNSDKEVYGGTNVCNFEDLHTKDYSYHGKPYCLEITVPPLGIVILKKK
jgi:1,4-alpha-glucan branching enzyme